MKKRSTDLVKMAVLARESGVSAATIKYYLREGLLPAATMRTSRNMAYYDRALIPRIKAIKELQQTRFLPLKVIKEVLDEGAATPPDQQALASAIAGTLGKLAPEATMSRAELVAEGVVPEELDWMSARGLLSPSGTGEKARYGGDDLSLLRTLREARKAGITPEMLSIDILDRYAKRLRPLIAEELEMFREGVLPRAGADLPRLTDAATVLAERLIVLLRRRLILPMLGELAAPPPRRRKARTRAR